MPADIRDFIGLLKHSRGDFAGQPFVLQPWQATYLDRLFNTRTPDGLRQYRTSLLALPRKNGKSAMAAAVGLFMLCCDDIGAEVIVAAGDRSQASLLHTAAKQFVESCPSLAKHCKIYRNAIVFNDHARGSTSSMICISSEAGTKHGYNPSCVLVDEYHVFPDRELVDVLETGTGSRSQPLTIYITTAGTDMLGPCYKDWQRAEKIRDGVIKDDTFLPCIFAAPKDADPFDEATWKAANPNYGITLKPEYFTAFAAKAKESPTDEVVFRTLHLNQWVAAQAKWMRAGAFEANAGPLRPAAGRPCWCAIDLGSTYDTTAFVAIWPDSDGTYDVFAHFWIPEENARKRQKEDRVPYVDSWSKNDIPGGPFVTLTEGDITDYDVVRDFVLSFCEKNNVRMVGVDKWQANHLMAQLTAEGIEVRKFQQGLAMSSPMKLLETLIVGKKLRHAGNPVLTWQMSNVQAKVDSEGNIKPKKAGISAARIDGAVALIMAIGLASDVVHGPVDEPEIMVM